MIDQSRRICNVTSFDYDALGGPTLVTHNLAGLTDDVVMGQEYDAIGRRSALAATIGGTADFRNAYQYDYLNRMTQITQAAQTGGHAVAEKRIDLAYDADDKGQWTSITRYADLAGTQTVAATGYTYDQTDRLTGLTHSQGAATLADYGWTYDAANRLTQFTSLADGTSDYTYDVTDQVTGATHSYQADEGYTYDAGGNRTNTGYSTGSDNRLLSDGTYDYTYDAEGNRTKKTEIATGEATEYTWDHRNRLVKVVHLDSSGNPTQTLDYAYDIFDRRIGKSDTPAVGPAYLLPAFLMSQFWPNCDGRDFRFS